MQKITIKVLTNKFNLLYDKNTASKKLNWSKLEKRCIEMVPSHGLNPNLLITNHPPTN